MTSGLAVATDSTATSAPRAAAVVDAAATNVPGGYWDRSGTHHLIDIVWPYSLEVGVSMFSSSPETLTRATSRY